MSTNGAEQRPVSAHSSAHSSLREENEPPKALQNGTSLTHDNGLPKDLSRRGNESMPNEQTKLLKNTINTYNTQAILSVPTGGEDPISRRTRDEDGQDKGPSSLPPGCVAIMSLLMFGSFVASADSTMVVATYGTIASSFNALTGASWINTGFIVTLTSVQPILGKVSDILGRKVVLLTSYGLFAVGNLGIGLSQTLQQVIMGRFISGLGAGGMIVTVTIIITDIVPLRQVPVVRSYVSVIQTLGRVFGAPLGGYLADSIGWRWSFIGQFPLLAIGALLVAFKLPSTGPSATSSSKISRLRRIDFVGALLLFITIVLFLTAFALGGQSLRWSDYRVIGSLLAALVLGTIFTLYELNIAIEPIFPPQMIVRRESLVSNAISMLTNFSQFSLILTVPIYFQVTQHASNAQAASILVPMAVASTLGAVPAGHIIRRTGKYKNLTILGSIISSTAFLGIVLRWKGRTNWLEALYPVPMSFGANFVYTSNFIALTAAVAKEEIAMATGCLFLSMGIGLITGVSITASVQQGSLRKLLQAKLSGDSASKIIESVSSDLENIWKLEEPIRQIVINAYVKSLEYSHICSFAASLLSIAMAFLIKEVKMR